jgi:hypothetical protein
MGDALAVTILRVMTALTERWIAPARAQIRTRAPWLPVAVLVAAVPALALLWWALAVSSRFPAILDRTSITGEMGPPLPVLLGDVGVAVFGPVAASLVVVGLLRRRRLALLCVILGFAVSAWMTMASGVAFVGDGSPALGSGNPTEHTIMVVLTAASALAGVGIGAVAIGSLRRFGFLGLLAVSPVVLLLTALFLEPGSVQPWLTRSVLVALLVMMGWRRWPGTLLWPAFFVLYWMLALAGVAVDSGAVMLRQRGGGITVGVVADAMLGTARSAWRLFLTLSWDIFWPAAVIAAVVIAGRHLWGSRQTRDTA